MQLPKGIEFQWVSWPREADTIYRSTNFPPKHFPPAKSVGVTSFCSKKNSELTNYTVYPTNVDKRKLMQPHPHHDSFQIGTHITSETLLTLHSFAASHGCTITDQEPPASVVKQLKRWPFAGNFFPGCPIQICSNLHIDDLQRLWKSLSKERLAGQKSPCQRCKCSKNHPS